MKAVKNQTKNPYFAENTADQYYQQVALHHSIHHLMIWSTESLRITQYAQTIRSSLQLSTLTPLPEQEYTLNMLLPLSLPRNIHQCVDLLGQVLQRSTSVKELPEGICFQYER
jgi:hypothetical protein